MPHRIFGVGITGPSLTDLERSILTQFPPYAVVLFARNVESPEQLRALVRELKSLTSTPPLVMIDQEGGRVDRLRNLIPGLPGAEEFDEVADGAKFAFEFGNLTGSLLRYFDVDINLAPVVDIERQQPAKGLERRCFGNTAEQVVRLAGAFIRGQHRAGVAACLKHFPGIGLGGTDTHYGPSVIDVTLDDLSDEDLIPYRELGNVARAVMIGHAIYPDIDDRHFPASLSPTIASKVLREIVGFRGVAFSDDMEMHAVADLAEDELISERALVAGNDVILFCSHLERLPEMSDHLEERWSNDRWFHERVRGALERASWYRGHCETLQQLCRPVASSFEELLEAAETFRTSFAQAKSEAGVETVTPSGDGDRRQRDRAGTGPTGREEWT